MTRRARCCSGGRERGAAGECRPWTSEPPPAPPHRLPVDREDTPLCTLFLLHTNPLFSVPCWEERPRRRLQVIRVRDRAEGVRRGLGIVIRLLLPVHPSPGGPAHFLLTSDKARIPLYACYSLLLAHVAVSPAITVLFLGTVRTSLSFG